MGKFIDGSLKQYLTDLSDSKIVPGGGSAAALVSTIGAGLNLMVINLCMKRKNCGETVLRELEDLRRLQLPCYERLSALIDEDCDVFRRLMDVLSEKTDPQASYRKAAEVPLEICRESAKAIDISFQAADKAGKHIISDIGCASNFLESGFSSAKINVLINLKYIEDRAFVLKCEEELEPLGKKVVRIKQDIIRKSAV